MPVALVISDVDGTLVTTDKRLTPATRAAVRRLGEAGIGFTLASSRPPVGLKPLAEALEIRLPMAVYNGSGMVGPDLSVISQALLGADAAGDALAGLEAMGVDAWVFASGTWHLRDPNAPYADLERRTLGCAPEIVDDLRPLRAAAAKIVGVTPDAERLARLESTLGNALAGRAVVHRSQPYYLDITPQGFDKGSFVAAMAERLGIARTEIATLGDAGNDVAMFRASGCSIAMGNAAPEVREAATETTASNDADGFAQAIERLLERDRRSDRPVPSAQHRA